MESRKKLPKSTVVTVLLAIYFCVLCFIYAPKMMAQGKGMQMGICIMVEIVLISLTFLFLRRKEKLRK